MSNIVNLRLRLGLPASIRVAVTFLLLAACGQSSVWAQELEARLRASTEVTYASDHYTYCVIVTNQGSDDLLDVGASVTIPEQIAPFSDQPDTGFDCPLGTCNPGEVGTWAVGTLAPGESKTTYFSVQVLNDAPETLISNDLLVSASGQNDVEVSLDVAIDPTPLLRLGIAPAAGPVVPGEPYSYVLSYGNIGSNTPTDAELRAELPAGTTLISASDGGTLGGSEVVWPIGSLGPGAGGQVELFLLADGGLSDGEFLDLRAEFDSGLSGEYVVATEASTPVRGANPLQIEYAVSQNALDSGDEVTFTLTASNTGSVELSDAECSVLIPEGLNSFSDRPEEGFQCPLSTCDPLERATWTIGNLAPGERRTFYFRTRLDGELPGDVGDSFLFGNATGASEVFAWRDVVLDPTPLLELSLTSSSGEVSPGAAHAFDLRYGNIGTTTPDDVTLRFRLPEGTIFASATEGGTETDGIVTWDLSTVGPGEGGSVRVTIVAGAGLELGTLLRADAEIDPGLSGEHRVHSGMVVAVADPDPLEIRYSVSEESIDKGEALTYVIQASNSGPVDLKNTVVKLLLPDEISGVSDQPDQNWQCPLSTCDANEIAEWTIGTLMPGESRVIVHRTFVASDARSGAALRSAFIAQSATTPQITGRHDVSVDPSPSMRLSLAPSQSPVEPGQVFRYTAHYGNRGTTSPDDVQLRLYLPEEVSVVRATDGGVGNGEFLTWNLGAVGPGAGGEVTVWVEVDEATEGRSLEAYAELDSHLPAEYLLRSSAVAAIQDEVPLRVETSIDQAVSAPGDRSTYHVVVSNNGAVDLNEVEVRIKMPGEIDAFPDRPEEGFQCPLATCNPHEFGIWTIPVLAPGESRDLIYKAFSDDATPQGALIRTVVVARASSTGSVVSYPVANNDVSPLLSLGISGDEFPADPGETYQFTITYGNLTGAPVEGHLRFRIPDGMSFVSASDDGFERDGVVSWGTGLLGLGDGNAVTCTASFDGSPTGGEAYKAFAEIDPFAGTEYQVRSEFAFAVRESNPLGLQVGADRSTVSGADSLFYQLDVSNLGPVDLTEVSVIVALPYEIRSFSDADLPVDCPLNTCDPGELAVWSIGTMAPGSDEFLVIPLKIIDGPSEGSQVRFSTWGFGVVANDVAGELDVLVGDYVQTNTSDVKTTAGTELHFGARCFPAPIRSDATFQLSAPRTTEARVDLFDISGRRVDTVFEGRLEAGSRELSWQPDHLPSGVYLYRMVADGEVVGGGNLVKVR